MAHHVSSMMLIHKIRVAYVLRSFGTIYSKYCTVHLCCVEVVLEQALQSWIAILLCCAGPAKDARSDLKCTTHFSGLGSPEVGVRALQTAASRLQVGMPEMKFISSCDLLSGVTIGALTAMGMRPHHHFQDVLDRTLPSLKNALQCVDLGFLFALIDQSVPSIVQSVTCRHSRRST